MIFHANGLQSTYNLSIGPFFIKFYGEKDGDTPQIPNIDFSKFMASGDGS